MIRDDQGMVQAAREARSLQCIEIGRGLRVFIDILKDAALKDTVRRTWSFTY